MRTIRIEELKAAVIFAHVQEIAHHAPIAAAVDNLLVLSTFLQSALIANEFWCVTFTMPIYIHIYMLTVHSF